MIKDDKNSELENFLDEALSGEPGYTLPDNFADKVTAGFEKHLAWKQYLREFLIYLGAIAGILGITVVMMVFLLQETWTTWVNAFSSNTGIAIGGSLIFLFILFTDRVILKYVTHKGLRGN